MSSPPPLCRPAIPPIFPPQARFQINCTLLDSAISPFHNVGFAHWRSSLTPLDEAAAAASAATTAGESAGGTIAAPETFTIEGMEVHVFNDEGKIQDIWMLRCRKVWGNIQYIWMLRWGESVG